MNYISLFILLFVFNAFPQSKDPDAILKKVKDSFNKIKDYQVDVSIKVDIEALKVPDSHAKIYYKYPDKMHLESENFAMIPKEGFDFSPLSWLKGNWTSFYQREENIDGHNVVVIKVIPLEEHANVVLSTFWIDRQQYFIRKVESTTKTNGTFTIDLKYDDKNEVHLPKSMIFSFNIDRPEMHGLTSQSTDKEKKKNRTTSGKVYVQYYNYQINQGIPDQVFENNKKK